MFFLLFLLDDRRIRIRISTSDQCVREGSGSGSVPLTNASGSEFRRSKNIRIRIRNTGLLLIFSALPSVFLTPFVLSLLLISHFYLSLVTFCYIKAHFVNQCHSDVAGADVSALRLRFHPEPRGAGGKNRSHRQGRVLLRLQGKQFI